MSGKRLLQRQEAEVKQRADDVSGLAGQSAGHRARQQGSGNPYPLQGRALFSDGEIRDPLGSFSEQVGAYFG